MVNELQHGEVSLNIKRGLVHLVSACVDRLNQNGLSPLVAHGLGDVLTTGIQESSVIPNDEIKVTDLARELGVLRKVRTNEQR